MSAAAPRVLLAAVVSLVAAPLGAWERRQPGSIAASIEAAVAAADLPDDLERPLRCESNCPGFESRDDREPSVGKWGARGAGLGLGFGAGLAFGNGALNGPATVLGGGWRAGDSAVAGVTIALWGATRLLDRPPAPPWDGCPGCRDGEDPLNSLDRSIAEALGGGRGRQEAAAISDFTLLAATSLPFGLATSGHPDARSRDLAVVAGTFVVNLALLDAVKRLVDRPRPYAHFCRPYRPDDVCDPDAHSSFYSGHASTSFSMAVSAGMLSHYHGYRNEGWVWATGMTLATTTGILRIAADKHYFTDVAAGAAAGMLTGWLIPRIHRPERAEASAVQDATGAMTAISLPVRLRGSTGHGMVSAGCGGGCFVRASWHW